MAEKKCKKCNIVVVCDEEDYQGDRKVLKGVCTGCGREVIKYTKDKKVSLPAPRRYPYYF